MPPGAPAIRFPSAQPRRWFLRPTVLLGLALALAYLPLFTGHLIYNRDLLRFIYPIRWFIRDSFQRGDSPWWNPQVGLGYSMLADPQSGLFYPVNLLHLAGPLPTMVMVVMLLHLWWGAVGMARVARTFHVNDTACTVAGLAWALSGYVTSLWTNGARLPSAAWLPWQALTFIGLSRAARERRRFSAALACFGLAHAMGFWAGDFFVALMGLMLGFACAIVWLADAADGDTVNPATHGWRSTGKSFLALSALGVLLVFLLSAIATVPAVQALAGTERAGGLAPAISESGSFHPSRVAEFLAPEAFTRAWYRNPNQDWVDRLLGDSPISMNAYLGGSVLALLLFAFLPAKFARGHGGSEANRLDRTCPSPRATMLLTGAALIFLAFALGRHTPIYALLQALAPPFRYMRSPEKHLLAVIPCVALLASWGTQRLQAAQPRAWLWGLAIPGCALLLVGLGPAMFPRELGDSVRASGWHGLAGAAAVALLCRFFQRPAPLAALALAGVLVVDLATSSQLALRFTDRSALATPGLARIISPDGSGQRPFPRLFSGSKVRIAAHAAGDPDGDRVTRETLRDNLSVPFGIAILPGYGVANAPAVTALLGQGRLDALRLLAADFALLTTSTPPPGSFEIPGAPPGSHLYRLARTLPRVFVAYHARQVPASEMNRQLLEPEVVSGNRVLLPSGTEWTGEIAASDVASPCQTQESGNTLLRATCTASGPGLAVFVEQFAPGWHATVDGRPAPVLNANGMMRAVPIHAGTHRIELRFFPPGLRTGLALTSLGLLLLLLLGVLRNR